MKFGNYPAAYDVKVHGPYDPARYYGKPDKALSEVAVKDVGSWFMRRNKSPNAMIGAVSRAYWRWNRKYIAPKYSGLTFFTHIAVGWMALFYFLNYPTYKAHRQRKHHW